jgi:hypothetical protein
VNLTPLTYFIAVTGVAECIAVELDAHVSDSVAPSLGRPGRVGVVPGPEVPWDGCDPRCGGQLAIAFVHGPYPSLNFPVEVIEDNSRGNCEVGSTGVRCIASLSRCQYHPQGGLESKQYPTMEAQTAAARLQQVEGFYVRQAITCCLADMKRNRLIDDYRIGATDTAVNGACGEVSVTFMLNIV